ncbi:MAG TPA: response regulator transcription factor [Nakamurella sp.]|nr:response regulator transcription factor [Nakamurella sp.]
MIRVMIVDDHPFVRAGVLGVLNGADDIEVVGECEDGTQVPEKAASLLPHVVLMDVRMPAKSGMEATRDLLASQPAVRVVMLTGSLTGGSLHEAMQSGAVGYLLKGGPANELVNAVRVVAAGGTAWPSGDASP